MKTRTRFSLWIIRIVGAFILTIGMYSPALAADPPDLIVTKTHAGDFAQGDVDKTYTITVTNNGTGDTDGTLITLTDTLPTGIIAQSISSLDPAWTCPTGDISALTVLTCTRTTPLVANGGNSTITLIVDVAVNAGTGALIEDPPGSLTYYKTVTNTVNVTGGGDGDASNINYDLTRILMKPDLLITGYELRNEANTEVITNPIPNQSFWVRMTIQNRGGADTGSFYPGVFLDGEPNYGEDHDDPVASPVPLILGEATNFSGYRITPAGGVNNAGCLYYDPGNEIDEVNDVVIPERGNYTLQDFIPSIPAGTQATADVFIGYPLADYGDVIYDPIRDGLSAGLYSAYLYADPFCNADGESFEDNNSLGPIPLNVGGFNTGPADVDIRIAGILKGNYDVADEGYLLKTYPGTDGGLFVDSINNVPIVSSIRLLYLNKFGYNTLSELLGVTTPKLLDNYWMPAYIDNALMDSQVRFTNTSTTLSTTVKVYIGGTLRGEYILAPGASQRARYPGVSGGPVQIVGTPGVPILAGMRIIYGGVVGGSGNSFDEIMAYPSTQLHNEYFFPIYFHNNANLDTEVRIGNTSSTTSSTVQVYIADNFKGSYTLAPNTNILLTYPGTDGALRVVGTTGVPIVASIRLLYLNKWGHQTLSELMGVPTPQLFDDYAMPVYIDNNGLMDSQIRFTNTSTTQSTTVKVYIGSNLMGTYNLAPGAAQRARYAGVTGGPVRIVGTPGVPILAGMRIIYGGVVGGSANSFDEIMAYPTTSLDPEYWVPIYFHNNANLDTEVRIGVP